MATGTLNNEMQLTGSQETRPEDT